jgi:concanavalin A-like lectin/glucanase superfamily protein/type IX secretion system substrate protein
MKISFTTLLIFLSLSAFAQFSVPAYVPYSGLIAWFPFTGNAVDSTGHGHTGTVYGTTNTYDRWGRPNNAFSFNGTSDYIYVPPGIPGYDVSTDITASLTISAWVKSYNYLMSSQEQIYWRGDPLPAHDPHMLYFNGGEIRIRRDVDPGTTSNEVGYSVTGLDTNFHMLTGTYDSVSGYMTVYIDGIQKNTAYLPGLETYPTSTMYNYIGAVDGGTWQFFYGTIDELVLWDRALTPCEVFKLYYSATSLVAQIPVNDTVNTGGTATFTSTNLVPAATYQWQVNTGSGFVNLTNTPPYSGVFTQTLTVTPAAYSYNGYQYRCVTSTGTCSPDTTSYGVLTVKAPLPSAIHNEQIFDNITLTPNPNSGSFTISSQLKSDDEITVEITDLVGQIIYTDKIASNTAVNKDVTLNSTTGNGVYLLRLKTGNESRVFRMVVNR